MMDLQEVVNPHYAFPIVGVILCALLVFAFGFKSPGQPPSFDVVEEEQQQRKVSKKRKGKENQKVKSQQQNGKPVGTPPSQKAEVHVSSGKGKNFGDNKDKQQQKIEAKQNKKNKASQQQQSPQARQTKRIEVNVEKNEIPLEDNNEGEWVQQLSKKERKRKKEEMTSVVAELEKHALHESSTEHRENVVVVVDPSSDSQGSTPSKKNKNAKQKEEKNKQEKTNALPITVPLTEPKANNVLSEQGQQKKKKGKKEEMILEKNVEKNDISAEPKNNKVSGNDYISNITNDGTSSTVQEIKVEEAEEIIIKAQEVDETTEQTTAEGDTKSNSKKKKGKKKQVEVAEVETNLIKESSIEAAVEEVTNSETEPMKSVVQDNIHNNENIESEAEVQSQQNLDSGSNVAFDEMQDIIWQNAKTQRKKKKARREQ